MIFNILFTKDEGVRNEAYNYIAESCMEEYDTFWKQKELYTFKEQINFLRKNEPILKKLNRLLLKNESCINKFLDKSYEKEIIEQLYNEGATRVNFLFCISENNAYAKKFITYFYEFEFSYATRFYIYNYEIYFLEIIPSKYRLLDPEVTIRIRKISSTNLDYVLNSIFKHLSQKNQRNVIDYFVKHDHVNDNESRTEHLRRKLNL